MRRYVRALVDEGSYFEIQARWAREVTVGFARLAGEVVGRWAAEFADDGHLLCATP